MPNNNLEILRSFDFSDLNDDGYKEDAVREDITTPIIRLLGYKNSGDYKLVRSKPLKHPFLYTGTRKLKITLIPDYLLVINDKARCVIDAKSPRQDITNDKAVEQVYSYAFHPEVRSEYFGLCNGREIIIYRNNSTSPILHEKIQDIINNKWMMLYNLISTQALLEPHTLNLKNRHILYDVSLKAVHHFLNWSSANNGLYIDKLVAFIIGFPIIDLSWRLGHKLSIDKILHSISDDLIENQISEFLSIFRQAGFINTKDKINSETIKSNINEYVAAYFLDRQEKNWSYVLTRNQCTKNCLSEVYLCDKESFMDLMESVIDRMRGRIKKNFIKDAE